MLKRNDGNRIQDINEKVLTSCPETIKREIL